jgi:hypothetical protein
MVFETAILWAWIASGGVIEFSRIVFRVKMAIGAS